MLKTVTKCVLFGGVPPGTVREHTTTEKDTFFHEVNGDAAASRYSFRRRSRTQYRREYDAGVGRATTAPA
jgi:hypothetical protein